MRGMMEELKARLNRLKAEFNEVHDGALAALEARDYGAFGVAIDREREIIQQQTDLFKDARSHFADESAGKKDAGS
jgi:uncharacterized protein YceH (UPF0502 family)